MTEKKEYDTPTSHNLDGDNLEDVSGGVQPMPGECNLGDKAKHAAACNPGYMATHGCSSGNGVSGPNCFSGYDAKLECRGGHALMSRK